MAKNTEYDLVVIGAGINGLGIARDAIGQGLSVLVLDRGDIAGQTSSCSSKLIHGGLRYLEQYEFSLVAKALKEREVLMKMAPHIIWPMRFVLPHAKHLRPKFLIRIGMFLYDALGGLRNLAASTTVNLNTHKYGHGITNHSGTGFVYSDCWVQDARLCVSNAMDIVARGGMVKSYTECTGAIRKAKYWDVTYQDVKNKRKKTVTAKMIVNASGANVMGVLENVLNQKTQYGIRAIKGSHIVVKKIFKGDQSYILQVEDGRIVFAIPYENDYTLIGTTDIEVDSSTFSPKISAEEADYLCELTNVYFKKKISKKDVVWDYAGIRPLYDDNSTSAQKITRDYVFELDTIKAPILSIFGGKITTYRKLSESAMEKIGECFGFTPKSWTGTLPLVGGDIDDINVFKKQIHKQYKWLDKTIIDRFIKHYGTALRTILKGATSTADLGKQIAKGVYEAELKYVQKNEFVKYGEDYLYRRTKMVLHLSPKDKKAVCAYIEGIKI